MRVITAITPLLLPSLALAAPNPRLQKRCDQPAAPIIGCDCGGAAATATPPSSGSVASGSSASIGGSSWGWLSGLLNLGGTASATATASITTSVGGVANLSTFLGSLFGSVQVGVSTQIDALYAVWATPAFCDNISVGLQTQAQITLSSPDLVTAMNGCAAGYISAHSKIDVKAAAAIFKCDEKDITYVKHGAESAMPQDTQHQQAAVHAATEAGVTGGIGNAAAALGATTSVSDVWFKHPQANMCHSCTPCDKDGH